MTIQMMFCPLFISLPCLLTVLLSNCSQAIRKWLLWTDEDSTVSMYLANMNRWLLTCVRCLHQYWPGRHLLFDIHFFLWSIRVLINSQDAISEDINQSADIIFKTHYLYSWFWDPDPPGSLARYTSASLSFKGECPTWWWRYCLLLSCIHCTWKR